MSDYDVIVVGAGPAGSTAALCLARENFRVLLVDRGDTPGAKNVSGGRLYGHSLEKVLPGFAKRAPVERRVTRETISMLTSTSSVSLDFQQSSAADPASASHTVLRAEFDAWLASEAESAGCDLVAPANVDRLLKRNGAVAGVVAGEDELTSDVVILADGVNSLLAQQEGLKKELSPHSVAVGCKEVIELSEDEINRRFGLSAVEGAARLFAGAPSEGLVGGGFLYTNRSTVSLGLVVTVDGLSRARTRLPEMFDRFKAHPAVEPLIRGGNTLEYSAHLVPEGGIKTLPDLTADSLLVVGDAANLCLNLGYTVRGMDLAIASGALAAETLVKARAMESGYSKTALAGYPRRLKESFVLQDMATYSKAPSFIENSRLYAEYPELAERILADLFLVNGDAARLARHKAWPHLRQAGLGNLLKDVLRGANAV